MKSAMRWHTHAHMHAHTHRHNHTHTHTQTHTYRCMKSAMRRQEPVPDRVWTAATVPSFRHCKCKSTCTCALD